MVIYFQIFIAAFLNSYHMRFSTLGDGLCTMLTLISLLICFSLPLIVLVWGTILRVRKTFETSTFKVKYGTLYGGVNTNRHSCLLQPVFFFARRGLFVLIIFLLRGMPLAQVSLMCLL